MQSIFHLLPFNGYPKLHLNSFIKKLNESSEFNYIAYMKMPKNKYLNNKYINSKYLKNKYVKKFLYFMGIFIFFLVIIDYIVLPLYVSAGEHPVPNVLGKEKDEAIKMLEDAGLTVVVQTPRYDQKYPKNHVIFQKPVANSIVKSNRRVYITCSGGDQLVTMPPLVGKTIRDAKASLERLGFTLGKIDSVASEFPADIIAEQQYPEGREVAKGTSVNIKISVGPQAGMIRVPNILAKSFSDADRILRENNLRVGIRTYIHSPSMLPNTIVDQQPGEGTLVKFGDSVNVVLTQSKPGDKR
jgi:eukaryotic-like serine/threonine-protein kinase